MASQELLVHEDPLDWMDLWDKWVTQGPWGLEELQEKKESEVLQGSLVLMVLQVLQEKDLLWIWLP